jgi:septal ring factor EnvC (AmiA/AmiB activator)
LLCYAELAVLQTRLAHSTQPQSVLEQQLRASEERCAALQQQLAAQQQRADALRQDLGHVLQQRGNLDQVKRALVLAVKGRQMQAQQQLES